MYSTWTLDIDFPYGCLIIIVISSRHRLSSCFPRISLLFSFISSKECLIGNFLPVEDLWSSPASGPATDHSIQDSELWIPHNISSDPFHCPGVVSCLCQLLSRLAIFEPGQQEEKSLDIFFACWLILASIFWWGPNSADITTWHDRQYEWVRRPVMAHWYENGCQLLTFSRAASDLHSSVSAASSSSSSLLIPSTLNTSLITVNTAIKFTTQQRSVNYSSHWSDLLIARILLFCCHNDQFSRHGPRALLDLRHWPGRGGQVFLDVHGEARHLRELECRGAQQLPVSQELCVTGSGAWCPEPASFPKNLWSYLIWQ